MNAIDAIMNRQPEYVEPADPVEMASDLRQLIAQLTRRLREQADVGELTPSQTSALLRLLREGPLTLSGLARVEGVRPQSMSSTVAALQGIGHVSATSDPKDGRKTLLSVTAECRERLAAGRAARTGWLVRRLASEASPAERNLLGDAIIILKRIAAS